MSYAWETLWICNIHNSRYRLYILLYLFKKSVAFVEH